jgi:hypothetical protein
VRCGRDGEVSGWEMYVADTLHHDVLVVGQSIDGNLNFPAMGSLEVAEGDRVTEEEGETSCKSGIIDR